MAINILQKLIDLEAWKTGTWQELSMPNFGYQRMLLYCIKWPSSEMDCSNSWVMSRLIGVSLSIKMLLMHKGTSHSETVKLKKSLKIREASILLGTKQFFASSSTIKYIDSSGSSRPFDYLQVVPEMTLFVCTPQNRCVSYNSTAYYCATIL